MRSTATLGVLAAFMLPACGGDRTGTAEPNRRESSRPTVSGATEKWVERADATCARHNLALSRVAADVDRAAAGARTGAPGAQKRLVRHLGRLSRGLTSVFNELRALRKPSGDRRPGRLVALYGQMVSDLHWAVDYLRIRDAEIANEYLRKAEKAGAEAHAVAGPLGLAKCTPGVAGPGSG